MSSFIAAAPVPPPAVQGGDPIANDGFFPDVNVDQAYAAMRLDGTVTPQRLRASLVEAVLSVNAELEPWKAAQMAFGRNTLAEVPAPKIDGQNAHLHRYQRAIHCLAAAWLIERYRTIDTTAAGDRKAETENLGVDDLRRDARWAISDLTGTGRTTVELI